MALPGPGVPQRPRRGAFRVPRKATRALRYVLIGLAVLLYAQWSHWTSSSTTALTSFKSHRDANFKSPGGASSSSPVDYAWGSLLHRFQNHPKDTAARVIPPWRSSTPKRSVKTPARTLIVTSELAGLHKNGGIGTAYSELAHALADSGKEVQVSILLAHERTEIPATLRDRFASSLLEKGIVLHFVEAEPQPFWPQAWTPVASMRVWRFLRAHDGEFDIIHFPDNTGIGYFSALAKHEGLALQDSKLVVGLHGADVDWASMLNKRYPADRYAVELGEFERRSTQLADVVVAPSEYMLEYLRNRGWDLPSHAFVIPNIVKPPLPDLLHPTSPDTVTPITELVFFGRLEERKGIRLLIDAVEHLFAPESPFLQAGITNITFLGRDMPDLASKTDASLLLTQALTAVKDLSNATFDFTFLMDQDREQALDYLQQPHRLALLPSLADNSPSTVLECIAHSIRFLASNVGGVPELIHQDDQNLVLFAPLSKSFRDKIESVVTSLRTSPWTPVRQRPETVTAVDDWVHFHHWLHALPTPKTTPSSATPLVSICVTHYERSHLLPQLLDSLLNQTYTNFEVVLVDDGSSSSDVVEGLVKIEQDYFGPRAGSPPWRLLRTDNAYLGEARNRAAALAKGDYLLFLDDDDLLKPNSLQTLVNVATKTGAQALSTWLDEFATDINPLTTTKTVLPHRRTYWFLGQSLATGVMYNCFGSGNVFVTRKAFAAIGGFSTYREVGAEDWEFYMRLALGGHEQLVVPEELIFVRSDPSRYSMKFSMDPWDANFHALIPLLNDGRVQDLGLAHALMFAKATTLKPIPPAVFADSQQDFQLVQDWSGWTYSFEPAGELPTLSLDRRAVPGREDWKFDSHTSAPYISVLFQQPYVSPKGERFAAVRSFRSPRKIDVLVEFTFRAEHQCGDGTELTLASRGGPGEAWHIYKTWRTMDQVYDELRFDFSMHAGSHLAVWTNPLGTDKCDSVEVRLQLTPIVVDSKAWSAISLRAQAKEKIKVDDEARQDVENPMRGGWEEAIISTEPESEDIYHIALILDRNRFEQAKQVVRSATEFIKSRPLHFHVIAPSSLHDDLYAFFGDFNHTLRPYDHNLCHIAAKQVLPFSNPDIHLSAHCKMFLAEIITLVDRVLYLDTDTTILGDISTCYTAPASPATLIRMGVDMGDACQLTPDACWPIGMHWRVPPGLKCGNVPSKQDDPELDDMCAHEGELEPVQVNGGVAMMMLDRMRDTGFIDRYVQSVVHHYRLVGLPAEWGEQDFVNSYFRLHPTDLEFFPCGCNYQWFGSRREVKCGAQPAVIAHHWSHGIAARMADPLNTLYHHFLDMNDTALQADQLPLPPFPSLTPSLAGASNTSDIAIINTLNCPRQNHLCTLPYVERPYGQPVMILSRVVNEVFAVDLFDSIDTQTYPTITNFVAGRESANLPPSSSIRETVAIEANLEADYAALCTSCGSLAEPGEACTTPPTDLNRRRKFYDCLCRAHDSSEAGMYDLDALALDIAGSPDSGGPGWILYLNDDHTFVARDSLSLLMAEVEDKNHLIVFRSNSSSGTQDVAYGKKVLPRSNLDGVGFIFHSDHLEHTAWDGTRCGMWTTFESLSNHLVVKWTDVIPTMQHPLQRHLPRTPASDFKVSVVILESPGRISWTAFLIEAMQAIELETLVSEIVVLSTTNEDGAYGLGVKVINPSKRSGLAEVAAAVASERTLLLRDDVALDKPALTALITHHLDSPNRLHGFFTETRPAIFSPPPQTDRSSPIEDIDAFHGLTLFTHLTTRTLLTSTALLKNLSSYHATTPLHPRCHPILLTALSYEASGRQAPLRVLPPTKSVVDRVWDCRVRNWWDVAPSVSQPGDLDPVDEPKAKEGGDDDDEEEATEEEGFKLDDCLDAVQLLLKWEDWEVFGDEVGLTGVGGAKVGRAKAVDVQVSQWEETRRQEQCYKV